MRRTLRAYVLREVAVPLGVWVVFLLLLLLVLQLLRGSEVLLGSAVGARDFGRLVCYLIPHFLVMALPISFLLAVLLGLGRLSEDGEWVALQALGVGPAQVLAVPVALSLGISALMGGLAWGPEPRGLTAVKSLVTDVIKRNVIGDVKSGVFYEELENLTLYAEQVQPKSGRWTHVLLQDDRDPTSPLLVLAREGEVKAASGAAVTLHLRQGEVHRLDSAAGSYSLLAFERGGLAVGVAESIWKKNRFRSPKEELTPAELLQAAEEAEASGASPLPFRMHFHLRVGQALSPLSFALIAGPLALRRRRAGRGHGYLLGLGAYVVYHVMSRALENLGAQGKLPVVLASQLPNLLFALVGLTALGWMGTRGTGR